MENTCSPFEVVRLYLHVTLIKFTSFQNSNLSAHLSFLADNVYLDGFRIRNAKDIVVHVGRRLSNVKLIDMIILRSTISPVSNPSNERGLIVVSRRSEVQIISSKFHWNTATVLYNDGITTVHSTNMKNNRKRSNGSKVSL